MLKKLICMFFLLPITALAAQFIEGRDYQVVPSAQIAANKDRTPIITEFFSYGVPGVIKSMLH
nr:hypothetical protein [Legionella norrlandica]